MSEPSIDRDRLFKILLAAEEAEARQKGLFDKREQVRSELSRLEANSAANRRHYHEDHPTQIDRASAMKEQLASLSKMYAELVSETAPLRELARACYDYAKLHRVPGVEVYCV